MLKFSSHFPITFIVSIINCTCPLKIELPIENVRLNSLSIKIKTSYNYCTFSIAFRLVRLSFHIRVYHFENQLLTNFSYTVVKHRKVVS